MTLKQNHSNDPEKGLFTSHEIRAMLEDFRALVRAGVLRVTPDNEVIFVKPPGHAEGTQRAETQAAEAPAEEELSRIDRQLLEWIEKKRERRADGRPDDVRRPTLQTVPPVQSGQSLRGRIVERLAQRILDRWEAEDGQFLASLREEVAERIVADLLERLTGLTPP